MAFFKSLLGLGGGTDDDAGATQRSKGVFYQLNDRSGWTCVLTMCQLVAQNLELEGFTLTVCQPDGSYSDDMRLRAQQIQHIRLADGPLNCGIQFSVIGGGTFLFECDEGVDPAEDPVVQALLNVKKTKSEAEEAHLEVLHAMSRLSPLSPEQVGEEVDSEHGSVRGELYLWKADSQKNTLLLPDVVMKLCSGDEQNYNLCVVGNDFCWGQKVSEQMHMQFFQREQTFTWICVNGGKVVSWTVRVLDGSSTHFNELFCSLLYESKTHERFEDRIKKDDRQWFYESTRLDRMDTDLPESEDELDDQEMVIEEELVNDPSTASAFSRPGKNTCLAVSTMERNDRSFVTRGSEIGVFKTNPDGVSYAATIKAALRGEEINAGNIMMHEQDDKMIILDPAKQTSLYCMDVETETVIDEWKTSEGGFKLRSVLPESKMAQQQPQKTFLGLNETAGFVIDPRLGNEKHSSEYSFQYALRTNPEITCGATTGKGEFATGSRKGVIRLMNDKTFSEVNTRNNRRALTKTEFPGYGDPILAIDVTEDGQWVLATCEKYLLVLCTVFKDTTGFQKKMGKEKPAPLKLRLKPADVARVGKVSFTPARFNTRHVSHSAGIERTIVTSTGNFVVTWNFRHVKKGKLQEYQIKEYAQNIVMDQFMTGQDATVVVAMPSDVALAKRKVVNTYE